MDFITITQGSTQIKFYLLWHNRCVKICRIDWISTLGSTYSINIKQRLLHMYIRYKLTAFTVWVSAIQLHFKMWNLANYINTCTTLTNWVNEVETKPQISSFWRYCFWRYPYRMNKIITCQVNYKCKKVTCVLRNIFCFVSKPTLIFQMLLGVGSPHDRRLSTDIKEKKRRPSWIISYPYPQF